MRADKRRIFVVDDEPSITRLLKLNLEQTGKFLVATANTPEAAEAGAVKFQPDVILMDVIMPGISGDELASQFAANPKLKDVPIIFLTAAATKTEVTEHNHIIGGEKFIAKPVDLSEIVSYLNAELSEPHRPRI